MKQNDAKRLHAYSSIGQMGYIVLAVGAVLLLRELRASRRFASWPSSPDRRPVSRPEPHRLQGPPLPLQRQRPLRHRDEGPEQARRPHQAHAGDRRGRRDRLALDRRHAAVSGFASKWTIISSSLLAGNATVFLVLFGIIALFTSAVTLACYVKFFGMTFTSSGTEWTVAKEDKGGPGLDAAPEDHSGGPLPRPGAVPVPFTASSWPSSRRSEGFLRPTARGVARESTCRSASWASGSDGLDGTALDSAFAPLAVLLVLGVALIFAWLLRRSAGFEGGAPHLAVRLPGPQ